LITLHIGLENKDGARASLKDISAAEESSEKKNDRTSAIDMILFW